MNMFQLATLAAKQIAVLLGFLVSASAFAIFDTEPSSGSPVTDDSDKTSNSQSITGIQGLQVGDSLFDVDFVEGSCESVFGTCEQGSFFFDEAEQAKQASAALLNYIGSDAPDNVLGCESNAKCYIYTPYDYWDSYTKVLTYFAFNTEGDAGPSDAVKFFRLYNADTFDSSEGIRGEQRVWAVWSEASVSQVPVPAGVWLFGSAILALIVYRKKR